MTIKWEDLTFGDKAKLFRYWSIVTLFANIIQIFGALFFLLKIYVDLSISEFLVGFGCMLAWISLIEYLEYSPKHSFISKTLSSALPKVMKTLIGVLPIFIGISLFGLSLFGNVFRF